MQKLYEAVVRSEETLAGCRSEAEKATGVYFLYPGMTTGMIKTRESGQNFEKDNIGVVVIQ